MKFIINHFNQMAAITLKYMLNIQLNTYVHDLFCMQWNLFLISLNKIFCLIFLIPCIYLYQSILDA